MRGCGIGVGSSGMPMVISAPQKPQTWGQGALGRSLSPHQRRTSLAMAARRSRWPQKRRASVILPPLCQVITPRCVHLTTPVRAVWHLLIQVCGYVAIARYEPSWREESTMARRARTIPEAPSEKIELTQRDCLRCDRVFSSQGPYNRLCKTCLESLNASPTPDEEYTIGYL